MISLHASSPRRHGAAVGRRAFCFVVVLAVGSLMTRVSQGGSYLDRAALLIAQAAHETDYLRTRLSDKELARVVRRVAVARLKAAHEMDIPKEVAPAHPHVLLVLEAYERAVAAVESGQPNRFLEYQQRARDEEGILRGVLKELGWALPKP